MRVLVPLTDPPEVPPAPAWKAGAVAPVPAALPEAAGVGGAVVRGIGSV
ncbi:hypothetical protein WHI96_18025 [Pseudonocardia tropica]|uniref:Uncharacterized protein n=1 Tax=Pseudonocardia tropica TaxID=681289 RepID=A0ABV1JXM8_9PSEU